MIRTLSSFSAPFLLLFCVSFAFAEKVTFSGFVTTVGTPNDYRVNDLPVHCENGSTENVIVDHKKKLSEKTCPQRVFGESLTVVGSKQKTGPVTARQVEIDKPEDLPVKGLAIIGRVVEPLKDGRIVVRADGYPLVIDGKTDWDFVDSDGRKYALEDVAPNVWIAYKGTLHPDGTVSVLAAGLGHNIVTASEDHLRKSKEFKAEEVTEDDRQSKVGRWVLGLNGKRLPAYKDEEMQTRIRTVGNKLIPEYQRNLPAGDPTKIDFRFQLVDDAKVFGSEDMPSGIILVPYQTVQKLKSDSELAEVLASGIADVLQKQVYRREPAVKALTTASLAAAATGLFVPGVGLASLVTDHRAAALEREAVQDCTRESLGLMHDAGYDVREAPVTWWLLEADRKKKSLVQTRMPEMSEYLYTVLWTAWAKETGEQPGS